MMKKQRVNRREFIGVSGAMVGAIASGRVLGANDRLNIGLIGCGRRNLLAEVLDSEAEGNVQVAAICDTWKQKREAGLDRVRSKTGRTARGIVSYQDLLAMDEIDAVVIATPDHGHCTQLIDAIDAGKHVYVEKPLAMNVDELSRAYEKVRASDRVVQVGTQMRSFGRSQGARKFIGDGRLGKTLKIEQVRNAADPYWSSYGGAEFYSLRPRAEDVDWNAFLMGHEKRPFDPDLYQNWYGHREFSKGAHTQLMVHFIDLIHYIHNTGCPSRVVAYSGKMMPDGRYTVADSIEVVLEYPEGFVVRYCTLLGNGANNYAKWFGTRGTLDAQSLSPRRSWKASGEGSSAPDRLEGEVEIQPEEVPSHLADWYRAIRGGGVTIAPIEAGWNHAIAALMAEESMTKGKEVRYDPETRTFS